MEEQPTDRESEVEQQKDPEVKDKRKAEVWHKFDVGRDPKTKKITKASCKFCSIDLKVTTNTGTSSMLKHLRSCNGHPNNIDKSQPKINIGDTIDEAIVYVVKRQKRPVPVPTSSDQVQFQFQKFRIWSDQFQFQILKPGIRQFQFQFQILKNRPSTWFAHP
ncbi:hypothetical protein LXL04_034693 [Taraxacum kok-saghyz]